MFVTFEGPDGSGKSTIIRMVHKKLSQKPSKVIITREPGGTDGAEAIRRLILDNSVSLRPETEVMLHFAARHEHVENLIKPALADGSIVLSDRFYDSTMAYQHYGLGVSKADIEDQIAKLSVHPDLTVVLTVPYATAVSRRAARDAGATLDRYESSSEKFTRAVFHAYGVIALENAGRCAVVENLGPPEQVADKIVTLIERRMARKNNQRVSPTMAP